MAEKPWRESHWRCWNHPFPSHGAALQHDLSCGCLKKRFSYSNKNAQTYCMCCLCVEPSRGAAQGAGAGAHLSGHSPLLFFPAQQGCGAPTGWRAVFLLGCIESEGSCEARARYMDKVDVLACDHSCCFHLGKLMHVHFHTCLCSVKGMPESCSRSLIFLIIKYVFPT